MQTVEKSAATGRVAIKTNAPVLTFEPDGKVTVLVKAENYRWSVESPFEGYFYLVLTPKTEPQDDYDPT
jgi:hypothetical protein